MSSRKDLKKQIRVVCGDMAAECIIAKTVVPGVDEKTMSDLVIKIARLQDATLRKISVKSQNMSKAFKALKGEFNNQVAEIVKEMNKALPQEQKDLNKASK